MPSPGRTKAELRREFRARLHGMQDAVLAERSRQICRHIAGSAWFDGDPIAAYLALPGEPDLGAVLREAADHGKRLAVPDAGAGQVRLAAYRPGDELRQGPYGKVPAAADAIEAAAVSLWLVPGLAFAGDGTRLGRGKGYYDRLLAAASPTARILGVAFRRQVVDRLPREPHDRPVHAVVTERGMVTVTRRP